MAMTGPRPSAAARSRSTTARGLGWSAHQKIRQAALAALQDGDPCARCEQRGVYHPMTRDLVTLRNGRLVSPFLDLDDFPGRAYGGPQVKRLSWRKCNRSDGGKIGGRMTAAKRGRRRAAAIMAAPMATSRDW